MEIHSHSHTPRKKWTHYLWEFLMLFLAVFCGFLAENIREHSIEHQREKQFMVNLVNDLEQNRAQLRYSVNSGRLKVMHLDSLFEMLEKKDLAGKEKDFFRHAAYYQKRSVFRYNDGTIQELKNAGGLRLIRKRAVVDSINYYDAMVKFRKTTETYEDDYLQQVYLCMSRVLNATNIRRTMTPGYRLLNFSDIDSINVEGNRMLPDLSVELSPLNISEDDRQLLMNHLSNLIEFNEHYIKDRIELYAISKHLISFIKKEYRLE